MCGKWSLRWILITKIKSLVFLFRNKTLTNNSNKNIGCFESFPWIIDIIDFGNQGWSLCSCFRYFHLTSLSLDTPKIFQIFRKQKKSNTHKNRLRKTTQTLQNVFWGKNIHYTKTVITPPHFSLWNILMHITQSVSTKYFVF